jgi:pantothenate kinase type III
VLLIDVGNTDTVAARMAATGGEVVPLGREPTPRDPAATRRLATWLAGLREGAEAVGVCSVVPPMGEAIVAVLPDAGRVDHTWDLPFVVDVDAPHTVGADRWCNVAAAARDDLSDALVVDAGTATTIDVLRGGAMVGGLIAPGMAFAARQLQRSAPQLWEVPFAPCPLAPGRDTASALQAGAFHVGVHGIVGTVAALAAQMPSATVVITGGLGRHLVRDGWRYDPHWTLRGLAVLLSRRAGPSR